MNYNRGGQVLKTGRIGRMNVLRQQLLLPGEIMKSQVRGTVRLAALRERATLRMHARIDGFVTPVRWLWDGLADYLARGASDASVSGWPTITTSIQRSPATLGIGGAGQSGAVLKVFEDAPVRVFNEWFKWPEDADLASFANLPDGPKCVNLPHSWTRLQAYDGIAASQSELSTSGDKFDVRSLSELQAKYRQAIDQDFLAHGRYIELLREAWNANGSREVDKVPMRLKGSEVGVDPKNLYATNQEGLGSSASLYNFGIEHDFGRVAVPEHSVLTVVLVIRFQPIADDEINPMAIPTDRSWASMVGEPGVLAASRPEAVKVRHVAANVSQTVLGYLPAAWQYRSRWNTIDNRVRLRDSFPIMQSFEGNPTATTLRDATKIGEPFLSDSLGHYITDLHFNDRVDSPIPGPKSSLYSGVGKAGRGSAYPYPGPSKVI